MSTEVDLAPADDISGRSRCLRDQQVILDDGLAAAHQAL